MPFRLYLRTAPRRLARIVGRTLSTIALAAVVVVAVAVVAFAALGGGFGAKDPATFGELHTGVPVVMAHRGLVRAHPENSRAAFRAARRAGFDAVEIDVKRSADGRFYLFHDRHSSRLLGVDIDLSRQSLAELQRYPLHRHGRATDQRVLSLEAFADEFADEFVVYLDIKRHGDDGYRRLTDEIAGFIARHGLGERAIVGGDFLFVTYFEFRYPELHTSLGGPGDVKARTWLWIPKRFRPDFMIGRVDEITPGHVRWLKRTGLIDRWIVYGVDADDRERIERWGFTKLFVD